MKTFFLLVVCFFLLVDVQAGKDMLLPLPQRSVYRGGEFVLGKVKLEATVLSQQVEQFLNDNGASIDPQATSAVVVRLVPELKDIPVNRNEAYHLSVSNREICIEAETEMGIHRALQTLTQLIDRKGRKRVVECCEITDWPAFRIRGFMHDVGRGYISVEELKKEIAMLSRFKVNVFHWHLSENQAWRLESKLFPQLNDSANMTRLPGMYYTQEEAKELVAFCKAHQMMLIPEIDMPGHSAAFVRAFGHDMQSEEGMKILKQLVEEACDVFDVPYLHIGTDEVAFTNPAFVPEMVALVRSKGKKVISYHPGWNYKVGEIDMTQLWSYRGKAKKGIPAVDSRFHYLNHFDTFGDIVALYNSRIYNAESGSDDLAGVIMAVWNDRWVANERNIILENNFYPNVLAMAERAWRGGGSEYFDKNGVILSEENTLEFKEFADFERRMIWYKENMFKGYPFAYVRQTNVKWRITDAFPNGGDLGKVFPPEQEGLLKAYRYEDKEYQTRCVTGAGIYLRHVWGNLVPAFYKNPTENHTAYAYTWVYSPRKQDVGMWVEFQNYGRSEMDLGPLPGKWDYRGSRIWLNDEELLPPVWTSTHLKKDNEIPLGNENCVARSPLQVSLNKGWNKVFLKLPVGKFSIPEIRLMKWMFTAVFVTPDGEKAVEGLIYSPDKQK